MTRPPEGCAGMRALLPEFVGGDLAPTAAAVVREHLLRCAECRREAGAFQQSAKALHGLAGAVPAGVTAGMFTAMHAAIVEAVQAEPMVSTGVAGRWRRPMTLVAAAATFVLGWWVVRDPGPESLFERRPIGAIERVGGSGQAVPHAGGRVVLQQLGYEDRGAIGLGMAGRLHLRTLEAATPPGPDAPALGSTAPLPVPKKVEAGRVDDARRRP